MEEESWSDILMSTYVRNHEKKETHSWSSSRPHHDGSPTPKMENVEQWSDALPTHGLNQKMLKYSSIGWDAERAWAIHRGMSAREKAVLQARLAVPDRS
jgi:hypothetical protein